MGEWGFQKVFGRGYVMKEIHVYKGQSVVSPVIYLNVFEGNGLDVWDACGKLNCRDFTLVAISGLAWDANLSPWEAEPIFKGDDFQGGADEYLNELTPEMRTAKGIKWILEV